MATRKTLKEQNKEPNGKTPLCIRFKPDDLERLEKAAARDGVSRSRWIREAALKRAGQVLAEQHVDTIEYETAGGVGAQMCIRFQPRDFERITKAAKHEPSASTSKQKMPSPWIRAVVMHAVRSGNRLQQSTTWKGSRRRKSGVQRKRDVNVKVMTNGKSVASVEKLTKAVELRKVASK